MYTEAEYLFDWHSVIKKVLLIIIILATIAGIIFLINKPKSTTSYFEDNMNTMVNVAANYYKNSTDNNKLTLKEMIDKKMILEFMDEDGSYCDINSSYARLNNDKIEVFLKCNSKAETKVSNVI